MGVRTPAGGGGVPHTPQGGRGGGDDDGDGDDDDERERERECKCETTKN